MIKMVIKLFGILLKVLKNSCFEENFPEFQSQNILRKSFTSEFGMPTKIRNLGSRHLPFRAEC